ncbi:MAG: hypothetical protein H6594_00050 [Flavobacteriales bacterium]|nr:hypothetical protein [Flavobacteriales bacterium]
MDRAIAKADNGPVVLGFALGLLIAVVRRLSPGIPEMGDGVLHWMFARYAPQHPVLFLDGWAHPLFTLLAGPFSKLGLWGTGLLNALLAGCTVWVIISWVRRTVGPWSWLTPVLLFAAPAYFHDVLAGMTEILFGLATVIVLILLERRHYSAALMVASFTPLMRPEWVAFVPLVVVWSIFEGQWRRVPWVLAAIVPLLIMGAWTTSDPFFYFRQDTYLGRAMYGNGEALHFVLQAPQVLGLPLLVLGVVAMVVLPFLVLRPSRERRRHSIILVVGLLPALGIWTIHSFAWWYGGMGSLGLTRVLATSIPLLVLVSLHVLGSLSEFLPQTISVRIGTMGVTVIVALWAQADLRGQVDVPVPRSEEQEILDRLNGTYAEGPSRHCTYYLHPYIPMVLGLDPWDTAASKQIYALDTVRASRSMRQGDRILWDGHFAAGEGRTPLDRLLDDEDLLVREAFLPSKSWGDPRWLTVVDLVKDGGHHRIRTDTLLDLRARTSALCSPRSDTVPSEGPGILLANVEYPLALDDIRLFDNGTRFAEIVVDGSRPPGHPGRCELVLSIDGCGTKQLYHQQDIPEGVFQKRFLVPWTEGRSGLYLWVPDRSQLVFDELILRVRRQVDE